MFGEGEHFIRQLSKSQEIERVEALNRNRISDRTVQTLPKAAYRAEHRKIPKP